MIALKKSRNFKISREIRDSSENMLELFLELEGKKLYVVCIYGPNERNENFFENIGRKVRENKTRYENIIIIGDFNTVMDKR